MCNDKGIGQGDFRKRRQLDKRPRWARGFLADAVCLKEHRKC